MFYYKIYNLTIESDYQIEEAYEIDQVIHPDVCIRKEKLDKSYMMNEQQEKESNAMYYYYIEEHTINVKSAYNGSFIIENGNLIRYELKENYDKLMVNQLFLIVCLCFVRAQKGMIAFHGSGIVINEKGFIISGESGAGKSTLTNELLQQKFEFMADDMVAITPNKSSITMHSAFPRRKLCVDIALNNNYDLSLLTKIPEDGREKYYIDQTNDFHEADVILNAIVIIEPEDVEQVEIKELVGTEKLKKLIECVFRKELFGETKQDNKVLSECLAVAKTVPVYCMTRPNNKDSVKQMAETFIEKVVLLESTK